MVLILCASLNVEVLLLLHACNNLSIPCFRDEPILLFFSPIFLSGNSFFFQPILLDILLKIYLFCSMVIKTYSYIVYTQHI